MKGRLTLGDTLFADTVYVDSGSLVNQLLSERNASTHKVRKLSIKADYVDVEHKGFIDVTGQGYPAGYDYRGGNATATSGGTHSVTGHGSSKVAYGNFLQPELPGGGGGDSSQTDSTLAGGGVVRIIAKDLFMDGSILANAKDKLTSSLGAGAGGSIWLSADRIEGTGTLEAIGGEYSLGFGGGGRIALYSGILLGNLVDSALTYPGGTLYSSTSPLQAGNLILDNKGVTAGIPTVQIKGLPTGIIDSIYSNALYCAGCTFMLQSDLFPTFNGHWLEVNFTGVHNVQKMFSLLSHGSNRLVVDITSGVTLTSKASVGNSFQGMLRLNSLKIRGGAKGQTDLKVMINNLNVENGQWTDPENGTVTSP